MADREKELQDELVKVAERWGCDSVNALFMIGYITNFLHRYRDKYPELIPDIIDTLKERNK